MKAIWKFRWIACLFLVLPLCTKEAYCTGEDKDFVKVIERDFEIVEDGLISIDNRYGSVEVQTWNASGVHFLIEIKVDARSQSNADEIFEKIQVNFSNTSSTVNAITEISKFKSKWFKWVWDDKNDFQINYTVNIPKQAEIDIANKYGDVYLTEIENRAEIEIKYGNLRMDGVQGQADIKLGYGKGSLTYAEDMNLELSYGTMRVGKARDVRIESKYSAFEIEEATEIRSTSRYDNYRIDRVGEFRNIGRYDDFMLKDVQVIDVETKYSKVLVEKLHKFAELETKYGGIEIKQVMSGFEDVTIKSEYAGVEIGLDPDGQYSFDLHTKYAPIRHRSLDRLEITRDLDADNERTIVGYLGSENAPRIKATLQYGSLTLK